MNSFHKIYLIILLLPFALEAQNNSLSKVELNGYISNMQSVSISELPEIFPEEYEFLTKGDKHLYTININLQNRVKLFLVLQR